MQNHMTIDHFRVDQHFISSFERSNQLTSCDPKSGTFLACALLARGDITVTDMRRNIDRFVVIVVFIIIILFVFINNHQTMLCMIIFNKSITFLFIHIYIYFNIIYHNLFLILHNLIINTYP